MAGTRQVVMPRLLKTASGRWLEAKLQVWQTWFTGVHSLKGQPPKAKSGGSLPVYSSKPKALWEISLSSEMAVMLVVFKWRLAGADLRGT